MAKARESWFETVKEKLQDMYESFDFSNDNLIKIATYVGVGFGIGFSIKKFGSLLFFGIMMACLALYGLQYFDLLTVNIDKLKLFLGFADQVTLPDVVNLYWEWIKNHLLLSVSFCIGCVVGYKLG